MILDFHTHCFPDKIAAKAVEKLSFASGRLTPYTGGTVTQLQERMAEEGVDRSVVLSIATNAHQQKSVNDFAASINGKDGVIAFGSVYPYAEDALDELERIKDLGLKGVKLHPDYQRFSVEEDRWKPLYEKISSLGLITVFHAGWDIGFPPPYGATPEKMEKALSWFSSPVVAAHWGGCGCAESVLKHLCGKNVYFDTSFGYGQMPKPFAQEILNRHGTKRMLFGTDTPWHTAEMELRLLNSLELTEEEKQDVLWNNGAALLGINQTN